MQSHRMTFLIDPTMIDYNQHLNNRVCLDWIQQLALEHARLSGVEAWVRTANATWFVREHHIRYLRQAYLNDTIIGTTFIAKTVGVQLIRQCEFYCQDALIMSSQSHYVLVNKDTKKIMRLDKDLLQYWLT